MSKLTWFNRIAKLTLGLSLLASVNVMAQKDDDDDEPTVTSSQGYVVTNKGDTLKGEIIERDKKTGLRFEGDKIKLIITWMIVPISKRFRILIGKAIWSKLIAITIIKMISICPICELHCF